MPIRDGIVYCGICGRKMKKAELMWADLGNIHEKCFWKMDKIDDLGNVKRVKKLEDGL